MTALFIKGSKNEILNALGINYGYIFLEGYQPKLIIHKKLGEEFLVGALSRGLVTVDKAQALSVQLLAHNLTEDSRSLFETVRAFDLGENSESPNIEFKRCNCDNIPTIHGSVWNVLDKVWLTSVLQTLESAFFDLSDAVKRQMMGAHKAIALLQDMQKKNIALDDEDLMLAYNALPEEKRAKIDAIASLLRATEDMERVFGK